jgi:galactose-1-phosphate uridylyltransferase
MIMEIITGFYIGDIDAMLDRDLYKKYNINIIINLTNNYQFIDTKTIKTKLPIRNFVDYMDKYKKLLNYIKSNFINYNILVCSDEQYHTLTAALFLIEFGKIPEYDVKAILKNKNEDIVLDYDLSVFEIK